VLATRPRPWRRPLAPIAALLAGARLLLAVPVGYLTVLTGAAWVATVVGHARQARTSRPPATRFAVLIPAHDEDQVLGATLRAVAALDYPADLYRVHVVADHCTDRTVEIAHEAGAAVHEHTGGARGKGPALGWVTQRVLDTGNGDPPPDAFVIVDADTIVDRGFLLELDWTMARGHPAVQGQYRVREPEDSPAAGLRAAALACRHHLRPLGRTVLGGSSGLYGNGMAFATAIQRERVWSDHLTEDIEFQMELLLDDVLVAYAPRAVVEAQMPATLAWATTQNERWERGRLELARRYVPALMRRATAPSTRHRIATVDAALDHLVPPLSVLGAAVGAVTMASGVVATVRRTRWGSGPVLCAALAVHVGSGLVLARVPASVYRSLVHAPAMVLWKVRLWLRMLARPGEGGWVRTAREGPGHP
jgi:1,2-diacylglycerol 3-beta-glucosyltransferase